MKTAHRIAELRQYRGMLQADVAKAVGVTKATVCNWEHGRIGIGTARLEQIARALNCDVADLLVAPGSPPPPRSRRTEPECLHFGRPVLAILKSQ
jgi:transcriptional regulator with XRE-family HTH domain